MMSLDNSIVRKIYGTVIPLEECVCVVGGGGGRVLSSYYLGAFLMYFIEYAFLRGSGGYPPCMGSEAKPVAKNCLRAFQRAKMSPQDTQLNTI